MDLGSIFSGALGFLSSGGGSAIAGSIVNPLASHYFDRENFKDQAAANRELMELNQLFSLNAAATAHQREVLDLRKAGLNPLLAALKGGSSVPVVGTSSAGQMDTADVSFDFAAKRMSEEYQNSLKLQKEQIQTQKDQQNLLKADAAKSVAEAKRQDAESMRIMKHIAEGVGTPKQTQTVINNIVQQGISGLVSTAKSLHDFNVESRNALHNQMKADLMEINYKQKQRRKEK